MTSEVQSAAAETDETATVTTAIPPAPESPEAASAVIPQVGDVTPRGVIRGVRCFAEGGIAISFNGSDFETV